MNRIKRSRRWLCLTLCAALLGGLLPMPVAAADKTLLLAQAQTMALANSSAISKKHNAIILKQMKYVEAVATIKAKMKNKRSFRWSPLLSFKFPQQFNMLDQYELNVKPLLLQTEIATLQHEKADLRFQVLANVNKTYSDAYILQEKVTFAQQRLDAAQAEYKRNSARLLTGDATQSDVDKMRKRAENLTIELSNLKRSFATTKQKLSDLIKLDVTSGYVLRNPLGQMQLPREKLGEVVDYTLANDHNFYVAKTAASTALINLETYESLMRGQYGRKMDIIQGYINMAKQGQDIDYAAFQIAFKEFINQIDKPWSFQIRILFFRFTMEWFKGEIDGSRYIEDEMYAVYTACMEYANAKKDRDMAEKELRAQVADGYESLVSAWSTYERLQKISNEANATLEQTSALNRLGKADYTEVKDAQQTYQDTQLETLDALATYNTMLFDFDRLTCGAVTRYIKGESLSVGVGSGGDSVAQIDVINEPYYYIHTSVADLTFYIGVSIPDDFEPVITEFEVWNEGIQIGKRTPVGQELRHLTLDYGSTSLLTLRLYNGDRFVAECEINAAVARDRLELESAVPNEGKPQELGTYSIETTALDTVSTSKLTLALNGTVDAASYAISYGEQGVYSSGTIAVDQPFSYLTLLIGSLEAVTLKLYDANGGLLTTARFDVKTQTVMSAPQTT